MISYKSSFVKPRVSVLDIVVYDPATIDHSPFIEDEYRLKRDENMNCIYVKVGEKNVNEFINSFANGCSLKAILDRCQLMPIHDKVRYLQQTDNGVSADLTSLPKDATEAFIMLRDLKDKHPDVIERFAKGESFDSIVKSFIPTEKTTENIDNKGGIDNGKE